MKYMLLIYQAEGNFENLSDAQRGEVMAGYGAFNKYLQGKRAMDAGEALQPTTTASTVRVRDGKTLVTDGPFAETREQLGGFYLVEAADMDEAIEMAARIPSATDGCVEIRPIVVWDTPPGS